MVGKQSMIGSSDRSRKSPKAAAKQANENLVLRPFSPLSFLPPSSLRNDCVLVFSYVHRYHYLFSRRAHCPRRCWLKGCRRRGRRVVKIGLGGEVLVLALCSFEALSSIGAAHLLNRGASQTLECGYPRLKNVYVDPDIARHLLLRPS